MPVSPSVQVNVSGARGRSFSDVARATGVFGVLPTDTDEQVSVKFANFAIQANPNFKGNKGDPGGNVMAIGSFQAASAMSIPSGAEAVRTSKYSSISLKGGATYVKDPIVDADFVNANPRSSFLSLNGLGFRLDEEVVTPEMFGASGSGVVEDTIPVQAMLDWPYASDFRMQGRYYGGPFVLTRDFVRVFGSGEIIKKRGVNGPTIEIRGDGNLLSIRKITGFNGSCTATVSGNTLTVTGDVLGILRYNEFQESGTPIGGEGIIPGTQIVGYGTGSGGTGTYTLSKSHPNLTSRTIYFSDVPVFNYFNDQVYLLERNGNTIEVAEIFGSGGGGCHADFCPNTTVRRGRYEGLHDNGVLIVGNNALVEDMQVFGTCRQNCYYFTIHPGGTYSPTFMDGLVCRNIEGDYSGDTILEIGLQVRNAKVIGAKLGRSAKPALLWRDCLNPQCSSISFRTPLFEDQDENYTPFAVVPQYAMTGWRTDGILSDFCLTPREAVVDGVVQLFWDKLAAGFARISQSGVAIIGGKNLDGAGGASACILLSGSLNDITIEDCEMRNFNTGTFCNFGATPIIHRNLRIVNNRFENIGDILNGFNVDFRSLVHTGNTGTYTNRKYILAAAAVSPRPDGSVNIIDDTIVPADLAIPGPEFVPIDSGRAVLRHSDELPVLIPEEQYGVTPVRSLQGVYGRFLHIRFADTEEWATFTINRLALTLTKVDGTANLMDVATGFEGWAVILASDYSINIQRRGTTTGVSTPRTAISRIS